MWVKTGKLRYNYSLQKGFLSYSSGTYGHLFSIVCLDRDYDPPIATLDKRGNTIFHKWDAETPLYHILIEEQVTTEGLPDPFRVALETLIQDAKLEI